MPDQNIDQNTEHSLIEAIRSILSWQALVGAIKGIKYETRTGMGKAAAEDRGESQSRADMSVHSLGASWDTAKYLIDSAVNSGVQGAGGSYEVEPVDPPTRSDLIDQLSSRLRYIKGLTPERKSDLIEEYGHWFVENYGKLFKSYRSSGNSLDRVADPLMGKTKDAKVAVKIFAHEGSTLAGARTGAPKGGAGAEESTSKKERGLQAQSDEVWRALIGAFEDFGDIEGMVIDIQANIDAPVYQAGGIKNSRTGGHLLVTRINGVEVYKKPAGLDIFRNREEFLKATPFIFTYDSDRIKLADDKLSTSRHLPVGTPLVLKAVEGLSKAGHSVDHAVSTPRNLVFILPDGVSDVAEGQRLISEAEWPKFLEFTSRIFENKIKSYMRSTSYTAELGGGSEEDGDGGDSDADEFSTDIMDTQHSGYMHTKGDQYSTVVSEEFRRERDSGLLRKERHGLDHPTRSMNKAVSDRLNRFNSIIHGKRDDLESELLENVKKVIASKTGVDSIVDRGINAGLDFSEILTEMMASREVLSRFSSQLTESVLTFSDFKGVPYSVARAQEKYLASLQDGPQSLANVSPEVLAEALKAFSEDMPDKRLYNLVKGRTMSKVEPNTFKSVVGPILNANLWSVVADVVSSNGNHCILLRLAEQLPSWTAKGRIHDLHSSILAARGGVNIRAASREFAVSIALYKELARKMLSTLIHNMREVVLDAISKVNVSALDSIQEDLDGIAGGSVSGAEEMTTYEAQQHLSQAGHTNRSDGSSFYGNQGKHASDSEIMAIRMASKKMKGGL
jgi:hypothetical protein